MEDGTEVKSFERDGWRVCIRLTAVTSEGHLCGSADVFQGADHRCRLALHRGFKSTDELVAAHESKAMEWIDDWLRRDHSGTTGFDSL